MSLVNWGSWGEDYSFKAYRVLQESDFAHEEALL